MENRGYSARTNDAVVVDIGHFHGLLAHPYDEYPRGTIDHYTLFCNLIALNRYQH